MGNILTNALDWLGKIGAATATAYAATGPVDTVPGFDADPYNRTFRESDSWDVSATYTPADMSNAITAADGGDLEAAADICEAQWTDDRVRGTMQTRIDALLGLNNDERLEFETDIEAVRDAARDDWYLSAPETELSKLIRWGLHLGIGFAQRKVLRVKVGKAERWVPRIETWHPRHFSWDHRRGVWTGSGLNAAGEAVTFDVRDDDPHWITFCPYGETRPWAEGTWRAVGLLWLVKTRGLRSWGKHNDLHGSGAMVGKAAAGASPDDRKKFWADLKTMGKNARIVLPDGYELDVLEAEAKTWETYDRAGTKADTGIAIVHLGQPMTTEVAKGAQTGSNSAQRVRQDYLEFDAETLGTWGHDKHLRAWAVWNFGSVDATPWPRYNAKPPLDLQLESATLSTLAGAIDQLEASPPPGFVLDKETLWRRYNIPMIEGAAPKVTE